MDEKPDHIPLEPEEEVEMDRLRLQIYPQCTTFLMISLISRIC